MNIKTYFNREDRNWYAYQVDSRGEQIGLARHACSKELAIQYLKFGIKP